MRQAVRVHIRPVLLWTIFCSLFFLTILVGRDRFPTSDFSEQFHSFATYQAREMAAGRLPVWSPHSYGGVPFAADPQAAVFYPPRWLTIFLSVPWGFPYYALELEAIAHIWLAGLFTYALAFSITRRRPAALLGAVAFGLGGYLTSYPLLQLAILETIAWLPLALLLIRIGVRNTLGGAKGRPVAWFLGAGLVLALGGLAGHPQTFMHILYLCAAYYLFQAIRARWRWHWIIGIALLLFGFAFAGSAASWLPAVRYSQYSTRSEVTYEFVSSGMPMLNFVQGLLPASLALWSPEYIGLTGAVLSLFAVLGRKGNGQLRSEVVFWSLTAFVAVWLALGDAGVLFQLIYRIAPGFSLFRQQERLLGPASLSGALLAAQGLALWLALDTRTARRVLMQVAGLLALLVVIAVLILFSAHSLAHPTWLAILGRQLGLGVIVLILLFVHRSPRYLGFALAAILAIDMYVATFSGVSRQPGSPGAFWPQPPWLETFQQELEKHAPSRVDSRGIFWANIGEAYGWEDLWGISPLKPESLERFDELPLERRWQLLNVSHVIVPNADEELALREIVRFEGSLIPDRHAVGGVYRFENALPRAWLAYEPLIAENEAAALEILKDPVFDPAKQVVFHAPVPNISEISALNAGSPAPMVAVTAPESGRLHIEIETAAPAALVISEWAYPGWHALLDGQETVLYPADFALHASIIPAGAHVLELRFSPIEVSIGAVVSLLALAAAAVLAVGWRPRITTRSPARTSEFPWPRLRVLSLGQLAVSRIDRLIGRWLVLAPILLGYGLRVFRLGVQELRSDEAFSYLFGRLPLSEIVPALVAQGDPHSPLHYLLLNIWMAATGTSEFAMRYISVVAGVLILPLSYQLGRLFWGRRLGLLLALLLALSQSLVWISQDVRNQYALAIFFSLLSTLALVKIEIDDQNASGNKREVLSGRWLLYALWSVLAIYSHYYGGFVMAGHGLFVLLSAKRRRLLLPWLGAVTLASLMILPWLLVMWPGLVSAGQLADASRPALARYLVGIGIESLGGPAFNAKFREWFFLASLAFCVAGARYAMRRKRNWGMLFVTWLGLGTLGIYLVLFTRATFNPFYITVVGPAWWLLVALGLITLWRQRRVIARMLATLALIGLMIISGISLFNYYQIPAFQRTRGYRDIALHLEQRVESNDLFLANSPDPALVYYLEDVVPAYSMQPATFAAPATNTESELAKLAEVYDRLWFVPARNSVWDPEEVAFRWLSYHNLIEESVVYSSLELFAYRPLHSVDKVMSSLDYEVENGAWLKGVFITVDGIPVDELTAFQANPGSELAVTLLWTTSQHISQNYTVFIHLLDENGQLITQHDGIPLVGTRPTSTWQVGEPLLDYHQMKVPADKSDSFGRLVVGMYHTNSLERQLFANGVDMVKLAEVRIGTESVPAQ